MVHEFLWQTQRPNGWEHVRIIDDHPGWDVYDSVLIRVDGSSVRRGGYTLVLDKAWRTLEIRCLMENEPGVMQSIHLLSEGDGVWFDENEQRLPELDGCLDISIAGSPLAATIPVRRLDLRDGQDARIRAIEISLPELSMCIKDTLVTRRASLLHLGEDEEFVIDTEGFVERSNTGITRIFPE